MLVGGRDNPQLACCNGFHPLEKDAALIRHYRKRWEAYGHDPVNAVFGAGFNGLNIAPIVVAAIFEQGGDTGARLGEVPGDGMVRVPQYDDAQDQAHDAELVLLSYAIPLAELPAYCQPLLRCLSEPHSSLEREVEEVTLVCGKVTVGRTAHPGQELGRHDLSRGGGRPRGEGDQGRVDVQLHSAYNAGVG